MPIAVDQTADVIKDVKDNEVDSLCRVFHALKIEPCRLRLVSNSLVITGKNSFTFTFASPVHCYLRFYGTQRLIFFSVL